MKLIFEYSVESEADRIKNTLLSRDFFIEQGYAIYLPNGYDLNDDTFDGIYDVAKNEFPSAEIEKVEKMLSEKFNEHQQIIKDYATSLKFIYPETIQVCLTQYGVGGSYNLPNRIIVNVKYNIDHFFNLLHELTHLIIEQDIAQKYKLTHPEKEVLVNWILNRNIGIKSLFPADYILNRNKYDVGAEIVAAKCNII